DMNPLPVGVTGELYLGGRGLARGYLNRPGLTSERFVADPFGSQGGRLYRTGDLARWREDGQVEYLGRVDHQVKIRGFRIELGEIETQLLQQPAVREAVVVAKEGASGTRLVAYVALHADHAVTTHALRDALAQTLPDYMLPSAIVVLDSLPLNANGKVDRKRLPEPGMPSIDTYRAPSTSESKLLARVWQEVLGVERIGETDNFFALGGDSLSSLKVMARVRNLTDAKLDFRLRDFVQRPTIADLLGLDKLSKSNGLLPLNQLSENEGTKPLFCIHAGMGTIFDYQPLARQLQGMRTVYGIPCRMLADSAHCDISLQQMAEDYCRMIRSVQPQGPYHLLGWSLGGALAALMTAILEAQQQTVAFLGLIDSYVPGTESSEPVQDDWRQDFMAFIAAVLPGVEFDDPSLHATVFGQAMLTESNACVMALLEKACTLNQQYEQYEQYEQSGQSAAVPEHAAMGVEELAHTFMVARHLKMLSLQLPTLKPLATQVICWWAETREMSDRLALEQQLGPAEIHAHEIDADHYDILQADSLLSGIRSQLSKISHDLVMPS
ncbi:thioesterase domain-containing protein, partial [Nitrosomonas halophila]